MDIVSRTLERWGRADVMRPFTLGLTLYLTYNAYHWASGFAEISDRSGAEIALIIAAVIAPISTLQGYVFKQYITAPTKE